MQEQVVVPASLEEEGVAFPFSARPVPPLPGEAEGVEPVWAPLFWVEVELWACRVRFCPKYAIRLVVHDEVREPVLP